MLTFNEYGRIDQPSPSDRWGFGGNQFLRPLTADSPVEVLHAVLWLTLSSKKKLIKSVFPRFISELRSLRFLVVPSQICNQIQNTDIPATVEFLGISTGADLEYKRTKRVVFRDGVTLPGIKALSAKAHGRRCETRFVFNENAFPSLESLGIALEKDKGMLPVLGQLRNLSRLQIAGLNSVASLATFVDPSKLLTLEMSSPRPRGSTGTQVSGFLDGILAFSRLRHLSLSGFNAIDVSTISSLQLESVSFHWCKDLKRFDSLCQIPTLKRIYAYGSNPDVGWQAITSLAKQNGIAIRIE